MATDATMRFLDSRLCAHELQSYYHPAPTIHMPKWQSYENDGTAATPLVTLGNQQSLSRFARVAPTLAHESLSFLDQAPVDSSRGAFVPSGLYVAASQSATRSLATCDAQERHPVGSLIEDACNSALADCSWARSSGIRRLSSSRGKRPSSEGRDQALHALSDRRQFALERTSCRRFVRSGPRANRGAGRVPPG